MSFNRSQNSLCWSKCFVSDQKLIYVLCRFQTSCARPKDDLQLINSVFVLAKPILEWHEIDSIFGLAQNIWTGPKHFGTCRRTRHNFIGHMIRQYVVVIFILKIWWQTKLLGKCCQKCGNFLLEQDQTNYIFKCIFFISKLSFFRIP